jgi:hypothetical protein
MIEISRPGLYGIYQNGKAAKGKAGTYWVLDLELPIGVKCDVFAQEMEPEIFLLVSILCSDFIGALSAIERSEAYGQYRTRTLAALTLDICSGTTPK